MNRAYKSPRRDHLTLTTQEGKIELTEEELTRVTGGIYNHKLPYLTLKLETAFVSS